MNIVDLKPEYKDELFKMMREFYDSPALLHKSSDRVLKKTIEDSLSDNPYIKCFLFMDDGKIIGYSMVALCYTTEYGGLCVWIEDIFLKEEARGKGLVNIFFKFLEQKYPTAVRFKLEVEMENESAVKAYRNNGYEISKYFVMTKEIDKDL